MTCSGNSVQGYAGCMDEDHEKLVFTALPAIFQHPQATAGDNREIIAFSGG